VFVGITFVVLRNPASHVLRIVLVIIVEMEFVKISKPA